MAERILRPLAVGSLRAGDLWRRNDASRRRPVGGLVFLSATATGLRGEFEKLNVEVPEWLDTRSRELKREIHTRQQDATDKRVREIRSRLDALKTPSEKRAELEAELTKITASAASN